MPQKPTLLLVLFWILVFWSRTGTNVLYAHHETISLAERDYLKLISLHPFKDRVISCDEYDFYVTVVEIAPDIVNFYVYVEHSLLKRPLRTDKEMYICPAKGVPERFILESDPRGVSVLRYAYHRPSLLTLKIISGTNEPLVSRTLAVETTLRMGSAKPSLLFFIVIILILLFAIGYSRRGHSRQNGRDFVATS
jgi:hypothetical protein